MVIGVKKRMTTLRAVLFVINRCQKKGKLALKLHNDGKQHKKYLLEPNIAEVTPVLDINDNQTNDTIDQNILKAEIL